MNVADLEIGATLWLEDGSVVEVVAPSGNGSSVRVRYLESPFDDSLVGAEADCSDYDIVSFANLGDSADSSAAR